MVAPIPRSRERLTGAQRGRPRRFFRTLILQVEVQEESAPWTSQIPAPWTPSVGMTEQQWVAAQAQRAAAAWVPARLFWRDASWEDQRELDRMRCRRAEDELPSERPLPPPSRILRESEVPPPPAEPEAGPG